MTISNDGLASVTAASSESSPGTVANEATPSPKAVAKSKLHGRAFYESIGSPKFVLAPMVDQSEFVHPHLLPL